MSRKILAELDLLDGPANRKFAAMLGTVERFERGTLSSLGRVEKGFSSLMSSAAQFRNFSGLVAGGFGLSQASQFVDAATRIRNALREVSGGSETAFNDVYLAATRSLASFEAFAQAAARMQKAVGGRQTFDETIRQMETLNKLMALGGKTTQERASTMIQFGQALQANVLQGEELRALRENAPIELMRAIAEEAGGTIEQLKDLGSQGVITTDVMVRALKRLEQEADLRLKGVTVSIGDAAVQMQNGAIVATEAFDKGLGLSRATVVGLQTLGNVLGQNAEAFERFGQAVQIAAVFGLGSFIGGKIGAVSAALYNSGAAAREAATSAQALLRVEEQGLVTAAMGERQARQRVETLRAQGASKKALSTAIRQYDAAVIRNTASLGRYNAAAAAATAANARLAFSARAAAGAMSLMRGVVAFLGGWPGVMLAAGAALYVYVDSLESASERLERLSTDNGKATAAADALVEVQGRLKDALEAAGDASNVAAQKILADTEAEFQAKRKVMALEQAAAVRTQMEREGDIERLRAEREALLAEQTRLQGLEGPTGFMSGLATGGGSVDEFLSKTAKALAENERALAELEKEYYSSASAIARNAQMLADNFKFLSPEISEAASEQVIAAMDRVKKATEETMTAEERHKAVVKELTDARAVLVAEMERTGDSRGAIAAQVDAVDQALGRMAAEMAGTASEARGLTNAAYVLQGALAGLGAMRVDTGNALDAARARLAGANARLAAARAGRGQAAAEGSGAMAEAWASTPISSPDDARRAAPIVAEIGRLKTETVSATLAAQEADKAFQDLLAPPDQGGGGGGGTAGSLEDALSFIEQMMTAEERRAAELQKMVALRQQLVATYGPEAEIVARMDTAISRAKSGMDELVDKSKEFEDAIIGALMGSVDLGDFLLKKLTEAALQWALFNNGPWGSGGGGGLLGGLGSLFGGLFANGGVMTSRGPLPLRTYSKGGIARSPQLAVYGEGKMPEAYVPLPDGRTIPVSLNEDAFKGASQATARYVEVPHIVKVDTDDNGRLVARIERVRQEAFASDIQIAQQQQRGLGASINSLNQRGTT